ncbi:spr1630 family ClpXP-sensitive toxin [Paenibacillus dauci]|uniref:spr1630 family ClpXP-sensitive toxin n=1 Tax=Paenibacillus dauci TaxID=1567106 RepID=UPI000619E8EC|nr:hypothetical protein [Paenibacillus dauci]
MDQYKFKQTHSQMIVDAIVSGYRDYIEHRKDRRAHMKISSAFAWTKGNFIESKVADECEELGFTYKKSKAGLTWDYLQFIHDESKILFLIKNAAYFNPNHFAQASLPIVTDSQKANRTYLHELSKINKNVEFPLQQSVQQSMQFEEQLEQLTFSFIRENQIRDELEHFKASYNEFHILTYTLDDAHQISAITHYMPNPEDNIAYLVEDLSSLISGAELDDEDLEIFAPEADEDIMDPAAFDIGIIEEEKQN